MKKSHWVVLPLVFFAGSAMSETAYVPCKNCTSAQMLNTALRNAPRSDGDSVYVFDPTTEVIQRYRIESVGGLGDDIYAVKAIRATPEESEVADIKSGLRLGKALHDISSKPVLTSGLTLPTRNGQQTISSAHQLAGSAEAQSIVIDALATAIDKQIGLQKISRTAIVKIAGAIYPLNSAVKIDGIDYPIINVFTVQFPDGTTYDFKLTGFLMEKDGDWTKIEFTPVYGSGKDGETEIPEAAEGFGAIDFSRVNDTQADRFLETARRMGVPVVDPDHYLPPSSGGSFICFAKGGILVCEKIQKK